MNPVTYYSFILSALLFVTAVSGVAYIVYEQERNGEVIREGAKSLETWESLRPGEARNQQSLSKDIDQLHTFVLASESDTVSFLSAIDELAASMGVSIAATGLKVVKTTETGFDELSASFSVRGPQQAVEQVIRVFEALPYRSRIDTLSLMRHEGQADAELLVLVSVKE